MRKYIPVLKKTKLFAGVSDEELSAMLPCLDAHVREFPKGTFVLRQGECLSHIMLLLEGELHVQRNDYWGNRTIVSRIAPTEMFGEAYASPDSGPLLNDVLAVESSTVAFLDVTRIMTVCTSACRFHTAVARNLFFAVSDKNRALVRKLGHISRRTTREKLISYLSEEAARQNCASFTIPFNRQELADFLSIDRSAMSSELSRMRGEGLLEFKKNRFLLHGKAEEL